MFHKTEDGSIVDDAGKVIYFSAERFVRDICEDGCCLLCGAAPGSKPFNNEHVLPDWILRRFSLHGLSVALPNGTSFRYGQYKIPCCEDCNTWMGREIEDPVRELIHGGTKILNAYLKSKGHLLLLVWASSIFLKTHLRDANLRFNRDLRQEDDSIAEKFYTWELLHHIQVIFRSIYVGSVIHPSVFGSFIALPAKKEEIMREDFDYSDLYSGLTMLIRIDNLAFITVFNDSGAALDLMGDKIKRITGALSPIQLRELEAEMAWLNLHLKERPTFTSSFDLENEKHYITATVPKMIELNELRLELRGAFMIHLLRNMLSDLDTIGDIDCETLLKEVEAGRRTFLFDEDGSFVKEQFVALPRDNDVSV